MEPNQTTKETETKNPQSETTEKSVPPSIEHDTLMGVLCYIGPLVIIPYMTSLDKPFVKFHVKQGIILFGLEVIIYVLASMFLFSGLYPIIALLNLGTLVLAIIGIINVVGKKEVALPLIGQYADRVKI